MTGRSRAVLSLLLAGLLPACGTGGGGTLSPTTAPAAPTNLSTKRGNGEVTISWTASPGSGSFDVLRSSATGGPYFPVAGGLSVAGTSFTDTTVLNGIRYYYAVRAANLFGLSAPSSEVSVVPEMAGTRIAGSRNTSFAMLEDGSLWSWGANRFGELGDGTTREVSTGATRVLTLANVKALSTKWDHMLAVAEDGTVWSWGSNTNNLIDPSSDRAKRIPVQIPGLAGAVDVAAGMSHSMALTSDGTVWTWGKKMGPGETDTTAPAPVASLTNVVKIAAGVDTCYALLGDGTVWAWGVNNLAQLGLGFTSPSVPTPTLVVNLDQVTSIDASGFAAIALRSDGTVWGWGNNVTPSYTPAPVKISGLSGVASIAAGFGHYLVLRSDGTVMGWGSNSKGELGNLSFSASVPQPLVDLTGITQIAAGSEHSLAIGSNGEIWCLGNNDFGQLGSGTGAIQTLPVQVPNLTDVAVATGGTDNCLAIRTDATVWGWGDNGLGQLIPSGAATYPFRVQLTHLAAPAVTAVACGFRFSVVRRTDGTLLAFGGNGSGQLGRGFAGPGGMAAAQVLNLNGTTPDTTIAAISCGNGHTLARASSNILWSWGSNSLGQLGNNSMAASSTTPVQVSVLSGVTTFAAGQNHNLAVVGSGPASTVWAWGSNASYELGNTGPLSRLPVQVVSTDLTDVTAVAAGEAFSLAIVGTGPTSTVWAWGENSSGQLGDGQPIAASKSEVPKQVSVLTGATAIAAGQYHALALLSDKTVWCWGANFTGQLGTGTLQPSSVPLQVAGLSDIVAISAGTHISLAIDSTGTCWAWGSNQYGQVGIGSLAMSFVPIQVTK